MENVYVVSTKVEPAGSNDYRALDKVTNKMSNGETETHYRHREINTINDDGRAFNGNFASVGVAIGLVGIFAAVLVWNLVLGPLANAFVALF